MTAKVKITERRNPPPARRKMLPRPALLTGLLVLTTLLTPTAISAQKAERKAVERRLQAEFGEKLWALKRASVPKDYAMQVPDEERHGFRAGMLLLLKVENLEVKKRRIELQAQRLYFYQDSAGEVKRLLSSPKRYRLKHRKGKATPGQLEAAFRALFAEPETVAVEPERHWPPETPEWQEKQKTRSHSEEIVPGIYAIGMDGTFPRCYYCPEPEFSQAARKAKISGKVVLRAVITEEGWVAGIRLVQPAGFGLDQQAIQVVSNYRFIPARVEGRPVATVMNVEIYFTRSD